MHDTAQAAELRHLLATTGYRPTIKVADGAHGFPLFAALRTSGVTMHWFQPFLETC